MTSGEKVAERRSEGMSTSIFGGVVDGEIIEVPRGAVMPETGSIGGHAGAIEEAGDPLHIALRHLFLDAVGAEAGDSASHKNLGLVKRVAKVVAGIATDDQRTL